MEERRSNGFRVKPSFGQVLGYIQEGEPLTLDLPNRKASIYTSSHFYLDDYPNAPEPVSETPLPHTSLNPAAAFETADEGYSGTPFPRPPREFTRPSFLPDSDDGGMDPGQALRNDGLNPPRPPTLGGRLRESGIQAAETVIAGAAAGAAAATRSVTENQTTLALRGGGDWLDRTLGFPRRPPGLAPPPDEVPAPQIIWRWNGKPPRTSSNLHRSRSRRRKHRRASPLLRRQRRERRRRQRRPKAEACWQHWAREPWLRRAPWSRRRVAWLSREQALPSSAQPGPSREDLMRQPTCGVPPPAASHATDVQTLNGMQESGAVDHFYAQEQRRRQQPQVFRIDTTESEGEPQVQPQQQIRARPVRRPRAQPTPFGQVFIPVSSGSERVSRQSRGDRGPLQTEGSARGFAQPSFDALRQASEPEAA